MSNAERSPARVTASVGVVTVARAGGATRLPAEIQLVGAMNPCRRGCITPNTCACTPGERARYLGRLSAPLLDRIDFHVDVGPTTVAASLPPEGAPSESAASRGPVAEARERQKSAARPWSGPPDRAHDAPPARPALRSALAGRKLLARATAPLGLSARGHDRVLKVARTIADLGGAEAIKPEHLAATLAYRTLDRETRW